MTIFSPENDAVVLREHMYYGNNRDVQTVLRDFDGFVPVEKKGLGMFTYKYVTQETQSLGAFYGFFLGFAAVVACGAVFLGLHYIASRVKASKESLRDDEEMAIPYEIVVSQKPKREPIRKKYGYRTPEFSLKEFNVAQAKLLPVITTTAPGYTDEFESEVGSDSESESVFSPYRRGNLSAESLETPPIEQGSFAKGHF